MAKIQSNVSLGPFQTVVVSLLQIPKVHHSINPFCLKEGLHYILVFVMFPTNNMYAYNLAEYLN